MTFNLHSKGVQQRQGEEYIGSRDSSGFIPQIVLRIVIKTYFF